MRGAETALSLGCLVIGAWFLTLVWGLLAELGIIAVLVAIVVLLWSNEVDYGHTVS